jgi:hypothetical protein
MSFFEFLDFKKLDKNAYTLNLKIKLTKPHIYKKRIPTNIKTNAFSIHIHLRFANTYIQFILYPTIVTTSYTSYMTHE